MRSAGAAIRERRNSAAEVSSRQLRHRVDQVNNEPQVRVARARATRPLIAVLNALLLIAVVVIPLRALLGLGGSGQRKNLVRSGSLLGTEPCKKILRLVDFDRILHKRGVFGMFLNDGAISVGDSFAVTEQKFDEIPYAVNDRIRWYLKKGDASAAALDLVHTIGLPASYARAMPRLLKKFAFGAPGTKFAFDENPE